MRILTIVGLLFAGTACSMTNSAGLTRPPSAESSLDGPEAEPKTRSGGFGERETEVTHIWHAKCGTCHVPVEPGTHTRGALEAALERHHRRVRLRQTEWAELIDFLSVSPAPVSQVSFQANQ